MQNKESSSFIYVLNIAARLVAVCAIIAALVATVNYFAAPVIKANSEAATNNAIKALFDNAEITTEQLTPELSDSERDIIDTVYKISDTDGNLVGYSVSLSPTGFKGEVNLIAAFDSTGLCKGIEITATNDETSGIGTKVAESAFTSLFTETEGNVISDSPKPYIISGATKTSKPVSESVIIAKKYITDLISTSGEGDANNE